MIGTKNFLLLSRLSNSFSLPAVTETRDLASEMRKRGAETSPPKTNSIGGSDLETAIFPVLVIALSPSYDLYVIYRSEIFYSLDSAIHGARNMFFTAVNNWFRGGATISGLPFHFQNLENYAVNYYRQIWKLGGEGDSPQIEAKPCPAFVLVLQTSLSQSKPHVVWTLPACSMKQYVHTLPNHVTIDPKSNSSKKAHLNATVSNEDYLELFLIYGGIFKPVEKKIELRSYVQLAGI